MEFTLFLYKLGNEKSLSFHGLGYTKYKKVSSTRMYLLQYIYNQLHA
jgi:hypothetical protein